MNIKPIKCYLIRNFCSFFFLFSEKPKNLLWIYWMSRRRRGTWYNTLQRWWDFCCCVSVIEMQVVAIKRFLYFVICFSYILFLAFFRLLHSLITLRILFFTKIYYILNKVAFYFFFFLSFLSICFWYVVDWRKKFCFTICFFFCFGCCV